jgi:uncharacterized protein (TIGR00251 family)
MDSQFSIQEHPHGISFKVFVQPKSSKNMISGLHGDALKIKITSPPVDGAANQMCVKYLAKCMRVSKSQVEIISGHTSRTKQILVRYKSGDPSAEYKALMDVMSSFLQ